MRKRFDEHSGKRRSAAARPAVAVRDIDQEDEQCAGGEWFSATRFAPVLDALYGCHGAGSSILSGWIIMTRSRRISSGCGVVDMRAGAGHSMMGDEFGNSKMVGLECPAERAPIFCKHYAMIQPAILIAENGMRCGEVNNEHFRGRTR